MQRTVGFSPRAISDYQKLYGHMIGKQFTDEEIVIALNNAADRKESFIELEAILQFERTNLEEFNTAANSIIQITDDNKVVNLRTFNRLKKDLIDIYETITASFITVDDFTQYTLEKDTLIEKMESHLPVLKTELTFQRNADRRKKK